MGRWQPNARGRLEQAALELFGERGFEQTTVAEIAGQAGLTERTFFRHFADKREVLFGSSQFLRDLLVERTATAPDGAAPIEAIAVGLGAVAETLFPPERRDYARRRQTLVVTNPELQERELIKFDSLVAALAGTLRQRGVGEPAATLAGEAGITVFKVAFERWINDDDQRDLLHFIRESFDVLRAVTAGE